ncbi:hypothetical protein B566_EDAN017103, partial [Ephemera danica]
MPLVQSDAESNKASASVEMSDVTETKSLQPLLFHGTSSTSRKGRKRKDKHFRSKGVQMSICYKDQCCSPIKLVKVTDVSLSPVKFRVTVSEVFSDSDSESDNPCETDSSSSYVPNSADSSESTTDNDPDGVGDKNFRISCVTNT